MNLVQVGSKMWLNPENIVGVRWVESTMVPSYTQVLYRDDAPFMPNTAYLTSDWPIEKVQRALGLVSADDLDEMLG